VKLVSKGTKDRHGRLIAVVVTADGVNVNLELVKNGLAWHFKKYSKDMVYADAEILARKRKVNIWSFAEPVAPCGSVGMEKVMGDFILAWRDLEVPYPEPPQKRGENN
jgi:endonuclease YncB( thermonuclease family)